jgi:hypothetical protein
VAATAFEAGYVGGSSLVHAIKRTLEGHIALCGEKPNRVVGRFEPTDDDACQRCLAILVAT